MHVCGRVARRSAVICFASLACQRRHRPLISSDPREIPSGARQPADHYFCGTTFDSAAEDCRRPCPAPGAGCGHLQYCWEGTPCDARVMPGYGVTEAPTGMPLEPTAEPAPYDSEENYLFCGKTWEDANACKNRWCGDGGDCPDDQR